VWASGSQLWTGIVGSLIIILMFMAHHSWFSISVSRFRLLRMSVCVDPSSIAASSVPSIMGPELSTVQMVSWMAAVIVVSSFGCSVSRLLYMILRYIGPRLASRVMR